MTQTELDEMRMAFEESAAGETDVCEACYDTVVLPALEEMGE